MLSYHLEAAIKDLRDLIEITQEDMNDIQEAKHDEQFARLALKDEKIKSFEAKKAMIDHEISILMRTNPDKDLSTLLVEEQHEFLSILKEELSNLREINKQYAKSVLTVSNLYNSFLEKIVPTEMHGYTKVASKNPSILEVRA